MTIKGTLKRDNTWLPKKFDSSPTYSGGRDKDVQI